MKCSLCRQHMPWADSRTVRVMRLILNASTTFAVVVMLAFQATLGWCEGGWYRWLTVATMLGLALTIIDSIWSARRRITI